MRPLYLDGWPLYFIGGPYIPMSALICKSADITIYATAMKNKFSQVPANHLPDRLGRPTPRQQPRNTPSTHRRTQLDLAEFLGFCYPTGLAVVAFAVSSLIFAVVPGLILYFFRVASPPRRCLIALWYSRISLTWFASFGLMSGNRSVRSLWTVLLDTPNSFAIIRTVFLVSTI